MVSPAEGHSREGRLLEAKVGARVAWGIDKWGEHLDLRVS